MWLVLGKVNSKEATIFYFWERSNRSIISLSSLIIAFDHIIPSKNHGTIHVWSCESCFEKQLLMVYNKSNKVILNLQHWTFLKNFLFLGLWQNLQFTQQALLYIARIEGPSLFVLLHDLICVVLYANPQSVLKAKPWQLETNRFNFYSSSYLFIKKKKKIKLFEKLITCFWCLLY